MLTEAEIEIVNDADQVEDRVRIVGTGAVSLATKGTCRLQMSFDDPSDVDAVITLSDGLVFILAKRHQVLSIDGEYLRIAERRDVLQECVALIAAMERRLRVRTVVNTNASLMSSVGAVIRSQPSELEAWAAAAAARGARRVSEQVVRLRARGIIDAQGKLLVPFPDDMRPDSKTDV